MSWLEFTQLEHVAVKVLVKILSRSQFISLQAFGQSSSLQKELIFSFKGIFLQDESMLENKLHEFPDVNCWQQTT